MATAWKNAKNGKVNVVLNAGSTDEIRFNVKGLAFSPTDVVKRIAEHRDEDGLSLIPLKGKKQETKRLADDGSELVSSYANRAEMDSSELANVAAAAFGIVKPETVNPPVNVGNREQAIAEAMQPA